jgi:hypothetical protein
MSSWKSFDDMILQKMFSRMSLAYIPICFHFYECGQAGISSKDGIVHGIAMSFAPTQLADVMVNKLGMAFHMCMQPCLHVVPLMSSVLKMDP